MIRDEKLISVIVPVYNVKNTLEFCIKSICSQTYKFLEILIVDDGSTDGSDLICDRLQKTDTRIKVFHKNNGGLSDARNFGLKNATGDIISFIDSDDVIHCRFYEVLISYLLKYNAEIVSSSIIDFYNFDFSLQFKINQDIKINQCSEYNGINIIKEYLNPSKIRTIHHSACIKIYDKKVLDNIHFPCGKLHEDLFFTFKVLLNAKKLVYIDEKLYFHYINKFSISNTYNERNFKDEFSATKEVFEFLEIKPELSVDVKSFCLNRFIYLLDRSCYIQKVKIFNEITFIKHWIYNNIISDPSIRLSLKIKLLFCTNFIQLFRFRNKVKNILGIRSISNEISISNS